MVVLGGPIGTFLLERHTPGSPRRPVAPGTLANLAEERLRAGPPAPAGEDVEAYGLAKHLVLMLASMWFGSWVSGWMAAHGPDAAGLYRRDDRGGRLRNIDDATGVVGMSQRTIDDLGTVALALFLVMALMTLRLWELAGLVVPLIVILMAQVALIALVCLLVVPRLMGRDYDAVVMASGFCGFMLGTTANAMANMGALVERYGPAPKAYPGGAARRRLLHRLHQRLLITLALNVWE